MFRRVRFAVAVLVALVAGLVGDRSWAGCEALRGDASSRGFYIGSAVRAEALGSEKIYSTTLAHQFNICTPENELKFVGTHPSQHVYNFREADRIVKFALANQLKIRGHTLVWHNSVPGWLRSGNHTREEVIAILHDHIRTVVGRYKGRVAVWDVVNEPLDDSGSLRTGSYWYQKIGPEYIDMAFQFAHEADPDAILYLNEYGAEDTGTKSNALHNLISDMLNRGIPIHGVGWQLHVTKGFSLGATHHANARRLAALGLEISVTELDVRLSIPASTDSLVQQANTYRNVIDFCLSEPNCKALVMWGFTDQYSWIPKEYPGTGSALIYDENYQPKPAFFALQGELKSGTTQFPRISGAWLNGKTLRVQGEGFQKGAKILVNGAVLKTSADKSNPDCALLSKNAGKRILPGDTLQVQNPDDSFTNEITFE